MSSFDTILETYRERLEVPECYTEISEATQNLLDYEVRRYGLRPFDKVAHGVLAFCIDTAGSPLCVPWLVAPDAPPHDIIGGRHGLVTNNFYPVAEEAGLMSYAKGLSRDVHVDDFIGTYVIKDNTHEAPFTVICDNYDATDRTQAHIELIKALSVVLSDHQILINPGGDTEQRSFMKIKNGSSLELPYGRVRGLRLDTIAGPDDLLGKARELANYVAYAQKHGLSEWEFPGLVSKAVGAFHDGRQVSLDELCQEVLTERKEDD